MNAIAGFIADLVKRLFKQTPKFFSILQVIGLLATAVAQLPSLFDVDVLHGTWKIVVTVAGITTTVVSQLAVPNANQDPSLKVK